MQASSSNSSGCPFGYGAAQGAQTQNGAHPPPTEGPVDFQPPVKEGFLNKTEQDQAEGRPNIYYGDYLQLDKILTAQEPVRSAKSQFSPYYNILIFFFTIAGKLEEREALS